jgi:hypothetical protein
MSAGIGPWERIGPGARFSPDPQGRGFENRASLVPEAQRRPWPCAQRTAGHNRRARRQNAVRGRVAGLRSCGRPKPGIQGLSVAGMLAVGMAAVLPPLLATGVVPLRSAAVVPVSGIVLGGTMTAVGVAARGAGHVADSIRRSRRRVESGLKANGIKPRGDERRASSKARSGNGLRAMVGVPI